MKISFSWLKEYIKTELTADEVARLLTACGLEVESVSSYQSVKGGLAGLVIGQVITCERHPNADKLSLTTVDVGSGTPLQIVCGAPNVANGQKVIVAVVGTVVHPVSGEPFEIKKSKIRGELSEGMICAEDEIGLGNSHAGIMLLPDDAVVGMAAKQHFGIEDDVVLEIGLTPNRVDAASHLGTARDLSALLSLRNKSLSPIAVHIPSTDSFKKEINGRAISV
ncbi:MAG: YtpR family tRNA-binding protein, partial [Bacteroidota bacterium]